jgi:hypothetical protein
MLSGGADARQWALASAPLPEDGYAQKTADAKAREAAHMDSAGRQGADGAADPVQTGGAARASGVDGSRKARPVQGSVQTGGGFGTPGELLAYNIGMQLAETENNRAVYEAQRGLAASSMAFDVEQQARLLGDSIAALSLDQQYAKVREWTQKLSGNAAYSPNAPGLSAEDRISRMNLMNKAAQMSLGQAQKQGLEVLKSQKRADFQTAMAGITEGVKSGNYEDDYRKAFTDTLGAAFSLRDQTMPDQYLKVVNESLNGLNTAVGEKFLADAAKTGKPLVNVKELEEAYRSFSGISKGIVSEEIKRMNIGEAGEQYGAMYGILSGEGLASLKEAAAQKNFDYFGELQAQYANARARGQDETAKRIAEAYAPQFQAAYNRGDLTPELFGRGANYFQQFWKDGADGGGLPRAAGEDAVGDEVVKRISMFFETGIEAQGGYALDPVNAIDAVLDRLDPDGQFLKSPEERDIYATKVLKSAFLRARNGKDEGLHNAIELGFASTEKYVSDAVASVIKNSKTKYTPEQEKDLEARLSRTATDGFISLMVSSQGMTAKQFEEKTVNLLSSWSVGAGVAASEALFGTVDVLKTGEPSFKNEAAKQRGTVEMLKAMTDVSLAGGYGFQMLSDNPAAMNGGISGNMQGVVTDNDDYMRSSLAEYAGAALDVAKERIDIVEEPGRGLFARVEPPEGKEGVPKYYLLRPSKNGKNIDLFNAATAKDGGYFIPGAINGTAAALSIDTVATDAKKASKAAANRAGLAEVYRKQGETPH